MPSDCRSSTFLNVLACGALCLAAPAARAAAPSSEAAPEIRITRAAGAIVVDGDLSDAAWAGAARIDTWFETNPGDNVAPPVTTVGHVTYDDRFFYVGIESFDPEPRKIRGPLGDHDSLGGDIDFAGVVLDTRNDGRTGLELFVNARGVQFDAVADDTSGNEDASPDFFWDAATRITGEGWTLEMRIPFSSLRYPSADPSAWGIILYRNYPRQYRYQIFSTQLPRGGNCLVCRANRLTGLSHLPSGGHLVAAPYASASEAGAPRDGVPGAPFDNGPLEGHLGLDVKWTPSASLALDGTVHPDFSQIESDVAQIGANERFALFFPEKRPFFLEGIELLTTPVQAVYTRTITSPRWGVRGTGKTGAFAYTGLVVEDGGGGTAILPGANESETADQEFRSYVAVGRVRRDLGRSFVSFLGTDREVKGGGSNRVFGPDFQWRPNDRDIVTGQLLWSRSATPRRPDLATEWDGRRLSGHAADLSASHNTKHVDLYGDFKDFGDGFRADDGFIPQVGFRATYTEAGYTFHPQGFIRRLRTFAYLDRSTESDGSLLNRDFSFGSGMDGRWNSFYRLWYSVSRVRAGEATVPRQRLRYQFQASPTRWLSNLSLEGFVGEEADFANARKGTGADVRFGATVRPTDHLDLRLNINRRWLNVSPAGGPGGRLFTAQVERLRATYTFTPRAFVRAIAQYVDTHRDPSLYLDAVGARDASFSGSLLLAYKVNWQTVLFLGYGDNRALSDEDLLKPADRQLFLKLSYAFQR